MNYPICSIGTYTGSVLALADLLPTLKAANININRLTGFTIITDKNTGIKLNNSSSCETMPYGSSFVINIDNGITSIDSMIFDTACSILYLNYYYI